MRKPNLTPSPVLKSIYSQVMAVAWLLLNTLPVSAQTGTAYTSTGWLVGATVPPILVTNTPGQVLIRGGVQTLRVQSTNPRLAGLRRIFLDGAYHPDGSGILYGSAYQESGTWDLTDPANPKFTLTSGLWELLYRGTISADGSLNLRFVGRSTGGSIDGQRLEEELTRAPGDPLDPAIPWKASGTLRLPPASSVQVLDNFNDNKSSAWTPYFDATLTEANGRLTVRDYWPGVVTRDLLATVGAGYLSRAATAKEGQTLEYRVDLVGMNEGASAANVELVGDASAYVLLKGRDFIHVCKPSWITGFQHAHLIQERFTTPNSNVVISLSLTRVSPNLIVTARILDKSNHDAVLYERAVVDTPMVDRSLTSAEILAASGMHLAAGQDIERQPSYSVGSVGLHVWQYNSDGKQPAAEATFDNLELRIHDTPPISVARAVKLTWPTPVGGPYSVEGAPGIQGPWLPVSVFNPPGLTQTYIPNDALLQFFRLREAP